MPYFTSERLRSPEKEHHEGKGVIEMKAILGEYTDIKEKTQGRMEA